MAWSSRALLALGLAGELGDLDDHELGRLQRGERDHDVDDAVGLVVWCRRRGVAADLECLARCRALERALVEQAEHEAIDAGLNGYPQRRVVRLEDHPAQAGGQ